MPDKLTKGEVSAIWGGFALGLLVGFLAVLFVLTLSRCSSKPVVSSASLEKIGLLMRPFGTGNTSTTATSTGVKTSCAS
jgi:hypothetical protein